MNENLLKYIIILACVFLAVYVVVKNWQTLKNISKIEDLRKRILTTVLFIAVYRLGTHILLPGIDAEMLINLRRQTSEGLLSLLDMFSGGAFSNASIFALGVMPYISASIVLQLLTIAVPYFQKLQKEGESGRMKINQYTRYLTIVILLIQGPSYMFNLKHTMGVGINPPIDWFWFIVTSTIVLAAGSSFILWLGERITDKGIGNGVSFIIMIGIIARFPEAFMQELTSRMSSIGAAGGGLIMFLLEVVLLFLVTAGTIMLVQGVRKIPVQYAKRVEGGRQYGGARQYIPLKVNAANVMPIIFAQAIMFIPVTIFGTAEQSGFALQLRNTDGLVYNLIYATLIILFTLFYIAVTVNPQQMADDLKRNNGFIPGVKPGKPTAEYIDSVMSRITWPGAIFLTIVAVLPAFARLLGMNQAFAQFFGGTSLIILVGVVLDTLQQIESHLLMRHYDGLLKTGRIKGRSGVTAY
jgi:preprotein translocase subunit SecY